MLASCLSLIRKKKGVKRCSQRSETALLAQQIIIKVAKMEMITAGGSKRNDDMFSFGPLETVPFFEQRPVLSSPISTPKKKVTKTACKN
ncbi:hypothetical protein NC651_031819 [Populus alba x Populus x berolinensis]|jgi:hypothetical protein|nr:hypothetical protein NC651_031819 [Populus alba x Populus x berolinensis]